MDLEKSISSKTESSGEEKNNGLRNTDFLIQELERNGKILSQSVALEQYTPKVRRKKLH